MNNTAQKAKIGNIISGDIIDNLKSMKHEFSFSEESMFDNNLTISPSKETVNIIEISDSHTNEEEYVKAFNKAKNKYNILFWTLVSLMIFLLFAVIILFNPSLDRSPIHYIMTLFCGVIAFSPILVLFLNGNVFNLKKYLFKEFYNLVEKRRRYFGNEVNKNRFNVSGGFDRPITIGVHDVLFLVLNKIWKYEDCFYEQFEFNDDIFKDLIKYNVLGKVQFNGKDVWRPENKDIIKSVDKYNYDLPTYAVTRNAINVFVDDDGISEKIFSDIEKHKRFVVTDHIMKNKDNTHIGNVIKVLCLMNVLTKKRIKFIKGEIVEFGPRYEAYREYMDSRK